MSRCAVARDAQVAIHAALSHPLMTGSGMCAVLAGLGYHLAWRQSDEGV